jgi:hypothetical protein
MDIILKELIFIKTIKITINMSGGAFDYKQHDIRMIADEIEQTIERSGRPKTREELKDEGWRDPEWYKKYPEDLNHYKYPDDVIEEFKKGVEILRKAHVYAQRIDWLVSGDDGEESFHRRLKEDLDKLAK